jgi:surface antigen
VLGKYNTKAVTQVKLRYIGTDDPNIQPGQLIYVLNTHEPVGNDPGRPAARYASAQLKVKQVDALQKEGVPVFMTGDFNSGYDLSSRQTTQDNDRNKMIYCMLTANKLMWDSYDAANSKTGQCPTKDVGGVDHIFLSTYVNATKRDYSITPRGNGSDVHNTLFADIVIPSGEGDDPGNGGTPTPGTSFVGADGLQGDNWCTDYVKYILARHSSKYKSGSLGDGKDVANSLGRAPYSYTVNHTPAVHAVVSFPGPPYGFVGDRFAGHVALVGQVNPDGSIVVEEFNFTNSMRYGTHRVEASEAKTLLYAHTEKGWH